MHRQPWPYVSIAHEPGKSVSDYALQYPDHIASTSVLGLKLHFIDLYGPQYRRYMFSQVNLWDKTKTFACVALSPAQGFKKWQMIIAAKQSKHRMFVSETALDQSLPQIKAVFKVLADSSSYPVLILNKYGGETVSVIVSLALFLLRADMQSIHHDYMQSYQDLAGLKEQILEGIRESGMTDDYAEPFLPFVNSLEQHIQTKHGGIEQYLLKCGLDESELQAIKRTLLSTVKPTGGYDWLIDV